MKRNMHLLILAALLFAVLAGCGPAAEEPTQVAAEPTEAAAAPTEAPMEPTAAPVEPTAVTEEPSKVVIVQNAEVRQMDPTLRPTTSDAHIDVNLYDGLVMRNPDMTIRPGLATEWNLIDDTTWEFKLREGVAFHDGEPFNADTVVAWFERLQTVETLVEGYSSSIEQMGSVESVEKVDEYTVRFITSLPDPVLPTRLSSYFLMIPPKDYIAANGDMALFEVGMGTGPYKFVEWVKDDHLLLEANEDYWDGRPAIDQIEFRPVPEPSSRVAALKAGEAQIADAIPPAVIPDIESDPELDVRSKPEATRTYWMPINTIQGGPLADEKVRQALNYAVDKQPIIDKLLDGRAAQNASIVTFQSFGYCDVPEYEYDPEKAKELLAEAGYADGFDLTINYSPGHYIADTEIVQAIGNYLEEVGINVEYGTHEWANFLTLIREQKMSDIFYVGKTNLAIDADYIFAEFEADKNFGWPYPLQGEALELYEQERQEMDDAKRAELSCEIATMYRDQAGLLFLWQQDVVFGVSSALDWEPRADGFLYAVDMSMK